MEFEKYVDSEMNRIIDLSSYDPTMKSFNENEYLVDKTGKEFHQLESEIHEYFDSDILDIEEQIKQKVKELKDLFKLLNALQGLKTRFIQHLYKKAKKAAPSVITRYALKDLGKTTASYTPKDQYRRRRYK